VFVNHFTTQPIKPEGAATESSVGARSAPSDLFDLLESKPVWSIEELAEVLKVSRKTLYKQAKRGNFPSFRIGSCVRVYGRGLADHLRGKMKK
jgi:excisionase family DNA binding protein